MKKFVYSRQIKKLKKKKGFRKGMQKSSQSVEMQKTSNNKTTASELLDEDIRLNLKETKKKMIKTVCCVRIKKEWTIRKQMLMSIAVLFICVFLAISSAIAVKKKNI